MCSRSKKKLGESDTFLAVPASNTSVECWIYKIVFVNYVVRCSATMRLYVFPIIRVLTSSECL